MWIGGTIALAVLLLGATLAVGELLPGSSDPIAGKPPFAVGSVRDALGLWSRNALICVLFAVLGVVTLGIVRPAQVESVSVRRRVGVAAAAFVVVLGVQVYRQGHTLAWASSYLGVPAPILLAGLLPHAILELTALLLPASAAAFATLRPDARTPRLWFVGRVTALSLVLLVAAAGIEAYASPRVYQAIACTTAEDEVAAQGGCKPCPPWVEAAFARAVREHKPLTRAAAKPLDQGCLLSPGAPPPDLENTDGAFADPTPGTTQR